ncbi:hypothetical protein AMEX_G16554 [Astyanax mexicanus]|uniref:Uncharacterized protein n=1 Tax=Astyanax mexicanus TaxID=7994 RepID=A0A8T2LD33_ASTMX|nr:hypothetical protein AMEX_G16554 [Astyanax mexicanus]
MWREFPQQKMLWISISKGVSSKQASGRRHRGPWFLYQIPPIMDGRKKMANCFPFGQRCPSPQMYGILM